MQAAAGADESDWARDVRVQSPAISATTWADTVIYDTLSRLPSAELAAGQVLLPRHGCTTCHLCDIPKPTQPRAPRLDVVGHKISASWAAAWLENPFAYAPESKMPAIALTAAERRALVAFLRSLVPHRQRTSMPERPADPYRGAELFQKLRLQCHQVDGEGGRTGPALDRLGSKTSARWLYTLLKTPQLAQPGTRSHDYHLVDQDALDLSAFLVRRFAGSEAPEALALARQAHARLLDSPYILFAQSLPLE